METFFTIAGIVLLGEFLMFVWSGKDSTDKPTAKWWHARTGESGLRVYVDHKTGVHYVKSSMFDKLQVRINADGTPYTGE